MVHCLFESRDGTLESGGARGLQGHIDNPGGIRIRSFIRADERRNKPGHTLRTRNLLRGAPDSDLKIGVGGGRRRWGGEHEAAECQQETVLPETAHGYSPFVNVLLEPLVSHLFPADRASTSPRYGT